MPLYASLLMWITWIIWWFIWSRDIIFYSSVLLFWFAIMWIIRHNDNAFITLYKNTWITIVTSFCILYWLQSFFSGYILNIFFVVALRTIYARGMQWHSIDWFWWWKKQLSNELLWFFLSFIISIFVLWAVWLSMQKTAYLFAFTVWFLCLLLLYRRWWHTFKSIKHNVYAIVFWFIWIMTLLYTIVYYYF